MSNEEALRLNEAACNVYLFREGLTQLLRQRDAELVRISSAARIESAVETVEAINRDSKGTIRCTLDRKVIPGVIAYAQRIEPA